MQRNPTWLTVVAGLMIDRQRRFLMYRRPAGKQHAGLWEFPGGKVEPGEAPDAALARELREELGITLDPSSAEPLGFGHSRPSSGPRDEGRPILLLLFAIRSWKDSPVALEGGAIDWFDWSSAAILAKPPLDAAIFGQARTRLQSEIAAGSASGGAGVEKSSA